MKRGALLLLLLLFIPVLYGVLDRYTGMAVCSKEYVPVCGIDGITYGNSCGAGDVKVSHSGVCGTDEFVLVYSDPDTGIASFLKTFSPESELFGIDYMETKDRNLVVSAGGMESGILALRADMVSDDATLPEGKDYFITYWNVSGSRVNSLGTVSGGNITDKDIESAVGVDSRPVSISAVNYSMRMRYGVIIEGPQAYALLDKVSLKVPSDIVKATVRLDDKGKNNSRFVTLGIGESVKGSYSHDDFSSIKDSTIVYDGKAYHISELVAVSGAPVPMIGSVSGDFRFGDDVYLELPPESFVYRYFFVDSFDLGSLNSSQGLPLEILGKAMPVYEADVSSGRIIIEYAGKIRSYYDGDPFVNENSNDTRRVFDIALGPKMQIGVKSKKSYLAYDDKPVRERGCYNYPFDYFSVCFVNLTVSEYFGLSFEAVKGKDFSVINPGWGNVSAVRVSSGKVRGISVGMAGKSLTVSELYMFPAPVQAAAEPAVDEVEHPIEVNGSKGDMMAGSGTEGKGFGLDDLSRYMFYAFIALASLLAIDVIYRKVKRKT